MIYYGITELAAAIGWDKRKVSVYLQRGKLLEPAAHAGKRALWTKEQVEQMKGVLKIENKKL